MTMLDDDRLAALLADAGAAFEVPATGPGDILARAAGHAGLVGGGGDGDRVGPDGNAAPRRRRRRLAGLAGRHRTLSVAACIVVLVALAGGIGALTRGPVHPTLTAAPSRSSIKAGAAPSTTTSGQGLAARHGTGQANDAAPSGPAFGASGSTSTSAPSSAPTLPKSAVGQPAKIEQTGSLTLTVGRGKSSGTVSQLTALAATEGGFVAHSQTQSGASPSGSVTLQVPVDSFAATLRRAQTLGVTSDLTTKASDVTGQYVDLQSRITALQATRQQYLTILAKATTVGDVLAVQEQIDSVQTQIEQLQGQLQLLTGQTSYSTLAVTVREILPAPASGPLPESGVVRAWHASIGGFVTGVEGVIRLAGPLLFALLLLGAVLTGGRAVWRRVQRHNL